MKYIQSISTLVFVPHGVSLSTELPYNLMNDNLKSQFVSMFQDKEIMDDCLWSFMTKGVKNRVTIVPSCHFGYSVRGHIRHIIFGLFWKSSLSLIVYPPSNLELDCIKLVDFATGVLWKFVRFLVEYSWSKRVISNEC